MPTKRFFCTVCNKIKRVRRLPDNTRNAQSTNIMQRVGTCDRHFASPVTRHTVLAEVQPAQTIKKSQKKVAK